MDVDCAVLGLKRSSSAPMINEIARTMNVSEPSTSAPRDAPSSFNIFSNSPRIRRFSTSSSTASAPRLTPRVSQLRQEECVDVAGREAAHEREIHSAMQISQSWEDLTIEAEGLSFKEAEPAALQFRIDRQIAKRVLDPLSINLSVGGQAPYSSPSPTRSSLGQRQCYSPGVHVNWKSNLSPSPTRKAFATRRSLSPIAIRPSCLGSVKRKFELEDAVAEHQLQPPAKRTSGLLTSATSRSEAAVSSPHPGTLSSAGTPESLSSVDSPGFSFRPLDSPSPSPGRLASAMEDQVSSSSTSSSSSSSSSASSGCSTFSGATCCDTRTSAPAKEPEEAGEKRR